MKDELYVAAFVIGAGASAEFGLWILAGAFLLVAAGLVIKKANL